jgi:hypothetical protein
VPRIANFRDLALAAEAYTDTKIYGLVNRFAGAYGPDLVLYGGITATEGIYGLKRIREITTDLDFVCTTAGIAALLDAGGLFYHEGFDVLFATPDNVPVTFAYGHIHDWPIDEAFFAEAETRRPFGLPLRCCSRRHSIMLKMRRTDERLRGGLPGFGKDALDILNMLAAPACREEDRGFDLEALSDLVKTEVSREPARLGPVLDFLRSYTPHLTGLECSALEPVLAELSRSLGLGPAS